MTIRSDKQTMLRRAFWSGDFPYTKWRKIMRARNIIGHIETIKTSFSRLPKSFLIQEIGEEQFIKMWPKIRSYMSPNNTPEVNAITAWDAIWGVLAVSDSQYPVSEKIAAMGIKRRNLLKTINQEPGISIYTLSKLTKRDYSRVYKDTKELVRQGTLDSKESRENGRKIVHLFATQSSNTKLYHMQHRK